MRGKTLLQKQSKKMNSKVFMWLKVLLRELEQFLYNWKSRPLLFDAKFYKLLGSCVQQTPPLVFYFPTWYHLNVSMSEHLHLGHFAALFRSFKRGKLVLTNIYSDSREPKNNFDWTLQSAARLRLCAQQWTKIAWGDNSFTRACNPDRTWHLQRQRLDLCNFVYQF